MTLSNETLMNQNSLKRLFRHQIVLLQYMNTSDVFKDVHEVNV